MAASKSATVKTAKPGKGKSAKAADGLESTERDSQELPGPPIAEAQIQVPYTFENVLGQPMAIATLRRGLAEDRLHHALLFVGPDSVGKERTARALACALVCTSRHSNAEVGGCGVCPACHRAMTSLHPDVVFVEKGLYPKDVLGRSTDEKTDISVDQIRRVVLEKVALGPHEAKQKLFIIRRAEELSTNAANALLKTLEEPPNNTRFVLLTGKPAELLPTIRSRTLAIRFAPLSDDVLEQLLHARGVAPDIAHRVIPLAGGSVENALDLAEPSSTEARDLAVAKLRRGITGSLRDVFDVTTTYASSTDDRQRLSRTLEALRTAEATSLRQAVVAGEHVRIEGAIDVYDRATATIRSLDRNAHVNLALESELLRGR